MSNVSDLTLEVLKDIRAELGALRTEFGTLRTEFGEMRAEQHSTNQRLDATNQRLDTLTAETRMGFSGVNQRIDSVL